MKLALAGLVLSITLWEIGCSQQASTRHVTMRDSSRTLPLRLSDEIVVSLESNPTTGYRWRWMDSLTESMVALGAPLFVRDSAPQNALGVGGVERFRFRPTLKGPTSLVFEYRRPWEPPESTAVGHVRFRFNVK